MIIIKRYIIINSSPKKIWDVFCDIEKWPQLTSFISKAYWNNDKKWTLDSSFTQVLVNIVPWKRVSKTKFKEIIPMKSVTWTGTGYLLVGVHTLKFEKIGNKTKVSNIEYFKGPLAPFVTPLIKSKFEAYFEEFLKGLKRKVEYK